MTDISRTIELWPVDKLWPHPKNSKKHPPEHLRKLAASIGKLGLANPPHIEPDGCIITGTGRWMAVSQELKWEKIPVVVRSDLNKAQAAALRISDNATVWSEIDQNLLREQAIELNQLLRDQGEEIDAKMLESLSMGQEDFDRLTSVDMGEIDESAFAEDIPQAVEDQKAANKEKEAEADATLAPIYDAFGFKRITIDQSRAIRRFMGQVEEKTGLKGAEALIAFISQH